jgi:hypothetical protein
MKVIIAGSRHLGWREVWEALASSPIRTWKPTQIVSGKQQGKDEKTGEILGADYWGEMWAKYVGIPVKGFDAK